MEVHAVAGCIWAVAAVGVAAALALPGVAAADAESGEMRSSRPEVGQTMTALDLKGRALETRSGAAAAPGADEDAAASGGSDPAARDPAANASDDELRAALERAGIACLEGVDEHSFTLSDPELSDCLERAGVSCLEAEPLQSCLQSIQSNPRGWLDTVDGNGVAYGWTCDPDDFSQPLWVHFYVDGPAGSGTFVGAVYANLMREPAVGDACGGWRNHGYAWGLPGWLWDGQWHTLYAYGINIGPGDPVPLLGSGMWFRLGGSSPHGWLDVIDEDGVAHGWTCDPDDFSQPLSVHFYVDGSFVGAVNADQTREPAVGDACGGWRNHGYRFILPESVRDGQWRTLTVWAINIGPGENVRLSGSPKGFKLDPSLEYESFEWGEWGIESDDEAGASTSPEVEDDTSPEPDAGASSELEAGATPAGRADASQSLDGDASAEAGSESSQELDADAPPGTSSTRCEWHTFNANFRSRVTTVLKYRGYFRVCYVPNDRIVSVTSMHGDATWICGWCGWRWLGNANGYPTYSNFGSQVVLRYRGTAQFCPPYFWCIGSRQPWVNITFFPSGEKRQVSGVV